MNDIGQIFLVLRILTNSFVYQQIVSCVFEFIFPHFAKIFSVFIQELIKHTLITFFTKQDFDEEYQLQKN